MIGWLQGNNIRWEPIASKSQTPVCDKTDVPVENASINPNLEKNKKKPFPISARSIQTERIPRPRAVISQSIRSK
jgi:hypothetical protein